MAYPIMYLRVPDERGFVFTQAFQSIGLGLPTAIGAALACPDRVTIAAVGDGGLFMSLPELETVARLRLPLGVVVYNDSAYGAEVHHFAPMGYDTATVTFPDVDFAALGRALGMTAKTVRSVDDLRELACVLADRNQYPIVLDIKVNPAVRGDEWFDLAFQGH
jgi:thiamine pyrophosphate-dependent acetolactate synthase large subunit-like protein